MGSEEAFLYGADSTPRLRNSVRLHLILLLFGLGFILGQPDLAFSKKIKIVPSSKTTSKNKATKPLQNKVKPSSLQLNPPNLRPRPPLPSYFFSEDKDIPLFSNRSEYPPLSPIRRSVALTTAVLPGILVHGLGHMVAGRWETGLGLFLTELYGVSLITMGAMGSATTGASRDLIWFFASSILVGLHLLASTYVADIYGLAVPLKHQRTGMAHTPRLQLEGGYGYIMDPSFSYRHLGLVKADWYWKGLRVSPNMMIALNDDNQRLELNVAWRFLGPRPHKQDSVKDSSMLEIEWISSFHRFGTEGFASIATGLALRSRLEMHHLDTALKGSFVYLRLGYAFQWSDLQLENLDADLNSLLLVSFGFGFRIPGLYPGSEFKFTYQHRNDDFTAGMKLESIVNGTAIGHPGIDALLFFQSSWGIRLTFQLASGYLARAYFVYRFGE